MNTNQDTALTNQDFEKWFNDFHIDEIPMYKTIKDFAFSGYMHATKASEQRIQELEAEVANLHTVMMAAAVEITEHWDAHCDEDGCGPANLVRRLENGYPEQYGYDAKTMVRMDNQIDELTASNNQLREALVVCKEYITEVIIDDRYHEATCSLDDLYLLRDKAINLYKLTVNATPEQSLAEHDNATIDRCKNIVADDALAITFQSMGAYRSEIIRQIGALKKQFNGMTEDETRNTMSVKGLSVGGET